MSALCNYSSQRFRINEIACIGLVDVLEWPERTNKVVKVGLGNGNKVIQTFHANRWNPSLDVDLQIGTAEGFRLVRGALHHLGSC